MDSLHEELSPSEVSAAEGLLNQVYSNVKEEKTGSVNVKQLKALLYYSDIYKSYPLAYKAISDLEVDPTTTINLEDFNSLALGKNFTDSQPPSIEDLCLVCYFCKLAIWNVGCGQIWRYISGWLIGVP